MKAEKESDKRKRGRTLVLSLGGSLIFPDSRGPDIAFLKKFRKLILEESKAGRRFIIICGGGHVNRLYNRALKSLASPSDKELDLLGIKATFMNAYFVRQVFGKHAHQEIMENPTKRIRTDRKVIIGCGWKPGCSTDKDAVLAARTFRAGTVVNLTNVDYAYTKDPRKHKNAKKIRSASWKEFRKIVGGRWSPKLDSPFDPVAARLAEKTGLRVIITKGILISNLRSIIRGRDFRGTVISGRQEKS